MNDNFTSSNPEENDNSIIDVSNNSSTPLPDFKLEEVSNYDQFKKLGQKFSRKLSLDSSQIELLDEINFSENVFNEITYCKIQILKQFIRSYNFLKDQCIPVNKSYSSVFDEMAEIIIYNKYNYQKESLNFQYTLDSIKADIYNQIIKYCENNVREVYGIKRKINTELDYQHPDVIRLYEKKILSKLVNFLKVDQTNILEADSKTNKILNETNTNRWKIKFEDIILHFTNIINFTWEVDRLVEINEKNPSVSYIYFEAAKFMTKHDKLTSLKFYFQYLEKDLNSSKFENKQFLKSEQKILFKNQEQINDFHKLVNQFIATRDLEKITLHIPQIFHSKRKKISINQDAIDNIQTQHSQTVELLDEYLNDDEVMETNIQENIDIEKNEYIFPELIINSPVDNKFKQELQLTETQISILERFEKSSYSIHHTDFKEYMNSRNLFLNSTIDEINSICFEILDDVLIEDEDEYFNIFPDYYKKLLIHD